MTMYSSPVTVKTSILGEFNFDNIPYANHVLIVENEDYEEIGRFIIAMVPGEAHNVIISEDGSIISIMYTEKTLSIDIPIEANIHSESNSIKIADGGEITFAIDEEEKVFTQKIFILAFMGIIAAFIIGIGYVLYIGRIQKKSETVTEFYEPPLIEETIPADDKVDEE